MKLINLTAALAKTFYFGAAHGIALVDVDR